MPSKKVKIAPFNYQSVSSKAVKNMLNMNFIYKP